MSKTTCAKCGGRMEQGFVAEAVGKHTNVTHWVEGPPETSFWSGTKTHGRKKLQIEAWRCGRCGYLEGYAPG